jgi:glyoxylase-like metal-dependent hydrolase (beta-lactamase superfamily II)
MVTWAVGAIEVTRVDDPGFELILPSDDSTIEVLKRSPWLHPAFVTDDWALRIGSSTTVIRAHGTTVLVDPFLAFDDADRLGPRLQALRDAGVEADDVDVVVNSHIDGLGVNLLRDGSPTFPRARYLVPSAEIDGIRLGRHPDSDHQDVVRLHDAGRIEGSAGDEQVARGVTLADAPGHNAGHHVVWVRDGGASAVVVGHLVLHPAQLAAPEVTNGDFDEARLVATRRQVFEDCVAEGSILVAPLFAPPGGGRVVADGDAWRLAAA